MDQVDGEAHPGKGHPGWAGENPVDRAAGTFDASQDDPGEGQGPCQPVEATIDGPLCKGSIQGGVLLVGNQPVDNKKAHKKCKSPNRGKSHVIQGKLGLVPHLVQKVTQTETHKIRLEPGRGVRVSKNVRKITYLHHGTT